MQAYVGLLRAVNVGGTGKLPMAELRAACEALGFEDVQTYIASGNVVFRSADGREVIAERLAARLSEVAGRPVGLVLRTAAELAGTLSRNPFKGRPADRVMVVFLEEPVTAAHLKARGGADEEILAGEREIFVFYPSGMGRSKLHLAAAQAGTSRNINTVTKLTQMAGGLASSS